MTTVLIDARLILKKPTGIGQYLTSLVPEIIRDRPDWSFHLLMQQDQWTGYGLENWNFANLTKHISHIPPMSLRQHAYLPRIAKRLKVDLWHYPHFDAPVLFGTIPSVVTIFDALYLLELRSVRRLSPLQRIYMRQSYRFSLKRASQIITVSQNTASDLTRLFSYDINKLRIIYLAADKNFRQANNDEISEINQALNLSRPFILSVGELRPHKNHVGLIKAYNAAKCSDTHDLLIVGQVHQDYDAPMRLVSELGLDDRVRFLTDIDADALPILYSGADLFVLVSYYEGFGLPVLEAMKCGCPVIASNTTALREVAGEGAYLVDPVNQTEITHVMDEVIMDTDLKRQLITRGTAWASKFSWKKAANETVAVYESALG